MNPEDVLVARASRDGLPHPDDVPRVCGLCRRTRPTSDFDRDGGTIHDRCGPCEDLIAGQDAS